MSERGDMHTSDFWRMCDELHDEPLPRPLSFADYFICLARTALELKRVCESPIEVHLGTELVTLLSKSEQLTPQFKLDRFRYDFALDGQRKVLIECDGAEFHSTRAQQENDRLKDQAASRAGFPLLRFSGSDIFRNAKGCALVAIGELRRSP